MVKKAPAAVAKQVDDAFTNDLLKETEMAKAAYNHQEKSQAQTKQPRKNPDQKFIDLMDDLDI